jgi:hypothetical protein
MPGESAIIGRAKKGFMQKVDPYHYGESCVCESCVKARQNTVESPGTDNQHTQLAIAAQELLSRVEGKVYAEDLLALFENLRMALQQQAGA